MAKMTIYVKDELHKKMKAVDENWSAIASQAFEIHLEAKGHGNYVDPRGIEMPIFPDSILGFAGRPISG